MVKKKITRQYFKLLTNEGIFYDVYFLGFLEHYNLSPIYNE